jgi:hypothetical protein
LGVAEPRERATHALSRWVAEELGELERELAE